MGNITVADLVVGFIITWVIGLAPPVIIRYAIAKKPLSKKSAIWIAIAFFFFNQVLFIQVMGSQNPNPFPMLVIAYVSVRILRKGHKKEAEVEEDIQEK